VEPATLVATQPPAGGTLQHRRQARACVMVRTPARHSRRMMRRQSGAATRCC